MDYGVNQNFFFFELERNIFYNAYCVWNFSCFNSEFAETLSLFTSPVATIDPR